MPSFKNKKFWAGLAISGIFLFLSLRNVNWVEVKESLLRINYLYLFPVVLLTILAHFARAVRWKSLLIHIKSVPVSDLFSVIMVTNLFLSTLPARLGEVVRAYLIGEKNNISKTASFSTIVVERAFDGLFTMCIFVLSLWLYPGNLNISIPGGHEFSLKKGIYIMSLIYVLIICFLLLLKTFPAQFNKFIGVILYYFPQKIKTGASNLLNSFVSGLGIFHDFKQLLVSLIITAVVWILLTYSYYLGLAGFGIQREFYLSFILVGFIVIAVMIPAAPGYIGSYHFAIQITLQKFFDVSPSVALSYAWVMWTCGMIVNIIPGLWYYYKLNLHLEKIEPA